MRRIGQSKIKSQSLQGFYLSDVLIAHEIVKSTIFLDARFTFFQSCQDILILSKLNVTFGGRIMLNLPSLLFRRSDISVLFSINFLFIGIITYSEYLFLVTVLTSKFFSGTEHIF